MSSVEATQFTTVGSRQINVESPWLGLKSFDEINQDFFFGRTQEIEDLLERILGRRLTILYGHSGLGKTSLLKAGVMPELRKSGWYPVFIRLAFDESAPTLQVQIIKEIFRQLADCGVRTSASQRDLDDLSLWELLHDPKAGFVDTKTQIKPKIVLIFDQFEEVWTVGREKRPDDADSVMLLLSALAENRAPLSEQLRLNMDDELAERVESSAQSLRIVFSLREDYLHWLERWRPRMPSIMDCRVELKPLSTAKALDAVIQPGKLRVKISSLGPIIDEDTGLAIVRKSAGVPPLLSLICERLNAHRLLAGDDYITADKLESRADDVLREFYVTSFELVPIEVRHFVEDRLVSESGVRESMNFETAERELIARNVASPAECLEKLVHARILSVDYRGGVSRVELTHDLLTPFAVHYRKLRREEEAISMQQARLAARRYARLKRVTIGVVIGGLVIASSLAAYAWHQRNQISQLFEKVSGEERKKTELLVREAKAYSTIGYRNWQEWLSDSRPYARPTEPGKSKWHEALANWSHSLELNPDQSSIRDAILSQAASSSWIGLPEKEIASQVDNAWTSESGNLIAVQSQGSIVVYAADFTKPTGLTIKLNSEPVDVQFDSSEKSILVMSGQGVVEVYSLKTHELIQRIQGSDVKPELTITGACFVPTKDWLAITLSDSAARLFPTDQKITSGGVLTTSIPLRKQHFSRDGKRVALAHPFQHGQRISLAYTDSSEKPTPLLNIKCSTPCVSDLFLQSIQERIIFASKCSDITWPFDDNEMAVSSAGDITYFYEFDLKNCDKRPWQRRMESLERRGELMIEYSNMQLSPDGRWLAAQVSKYVAATGGCAPAPVITRNGDNQPFREQPNLHRSTTQFVSTAIGSSSAQDANDQLVAPTVSNEVPEPPTYRLLLADVSQGIHADFIQLNTAIQSCFFTGDARWFYVLDSHGTLKAYDLFVRRWVSTGLSPGRMDQAKPLGNKQVIGWANAGKLVINAPPMLTPLLMTFEIPGSTLMLKQWEREDSSGVYAISEDQFTLCFTTLTLKNSMNIDRIEDATVMPQCVSAYDTSGRVAVQTTTAQSTKRIVYAPGKENQEVVLAANAAALLADHDRVTSAAYPNRFFPDLKANPSEATPIRHTTTRDGQWQILPFGHFSEVRLDEKFPQYFIDPDGERQLRTLWQSRTEMREFGFAARLQQWTELVPTGEAWAECALVDAQFLPDDKRVALARTDGVVAFFDLPTVTPQAQFKHKGTIRQLAFSHDGKSMLVVSESASPRDKSNPGETSGVMTVWDLTTGEVRFPPRDLVQRAVISHSGRFVLYLEDQTMTVYVLDCQNGRRFPIPIHIENVVDLAISPDDKYALIAARDRVYRWRIIPELTLDRLSVFNDQEIKAFAKLLSSLEIEENTGELRLIRGHVSPTSDQGFMKLLKKLHQALEQ